MSWSVPGQALWSADWAPTREGLQEGLAHALRLLTLLWCMKWLFARQSRQDWLLGLRSLCWPLVGLGLDVNRAALRLWLTLAETERLTGGASPHWRRCLAAVIRPTCCHTGRRAGVDVTIACFDWVGHLGPDRPAAGGGAVRVVIQRMRIALGVEYDGRGFGGWQTQPKGNTVQDALERAIAAIVGVPVRCHAAGRTDAGVHASGQVVHLDCDVARPPGAWVRG